MFLNGMGNRGKQPGFIKGGAQRKVREWVTAAEKAAGRWAGEGPDVPAVPDCLVPGRSAAEK